MVIVLVAVGAVAAGAALAALGIRTQRRQSERGLDAVLATMDERFRDISASLAQAVARAGVAGRATPNLLLTLDVDELLASLVSEAAARTGADGAAVRVEGPGGRATLASTGRAVDAELLERPLATHGGRAVRTLAVQVTYPPGEPGAGALRTALLAPFGDGCAIGVFSASPDAFRSEHEDVLRTLVDEAAVGLANARRFAELEERLLRDPGTGVANREGYERELEREVARAEHTGHPLSLVLVELGEDDDDRSAAVRTAALPDLARLVTRVTRTTDVSFRSGERQLAIVLPETREAGAARLTARLRDEAQRAIAGRSQTTFSVGVAEWRSNESVAALDARAHADLARPGEVATDEQRAHPVRLELGSDPRASRADALDALAALSSEAQRLGRPLALVALEVADVDDIAARLGRNGTSQVLEVVARRLQSQVAERSVFRTGPTGFALALSGATAHGAEALVDALRSSFDAQDDTGQEHIGRVVFCAGVTELAAGEDARSALGRAEHALRQASQAGPGTVVVALPG